jgi:glutathione synthase/RimK-type ligase-like ATP-grasp enzyme
VYVRKVAAPLLPHDLPDAARDPLRREVQHHIRGLLDILGASGATVVNPLQAELSVDGNKLYQQRIARSVGLRVPDTLVTNDPTAARRFYERHAGQVVVKLLAGFSWSMTPTDTVPTRLLSAEDLDHLDGLRAGPMCFQERIEAPVELRVSIVRGRCFAGAQHMSGSVDWRSTGSGWARGEVPADTAVQLAALMDRLGLVMGAIDLMLPADGPPVFLEVNPSGEWGMLQHALGHDIAGAIAEALLERS